MHDKSLSLAFAMHNSPGTYAVLIGSGVSSSAGIPTGWGIVQDLCRKVATLRGENPGGDPTAWYQTTFNEEPRYDHLIETLSPTKHEQLDLLRRYFEATEEEHEQNRKIPSPAHNSIAQLVKQGSVKLILTTNFDRLMEQALEEIGVSPQVAYTPEMIMALKPYTHSRCTIIKLHGDYREATMLNVSGDLSRYAEFVNEYLHRVFDEFGLIIAGWSGVWDHALRNAMLNSPSRRYSWYWLSRDEIIAKQAKQVVENKDAYVLHTPQGADYFFQSLQQQVQAITRLELPHPDSPEVMIQIAKDCLTSKKDIQLYDLLLDESRRIRSIIDSQPTDISGQIVTSTFQLFIEKYIESSKGILGALAYVSYFGGYNYSNLAIRSVRLLSQDIHASGGFSALLSLRYFPSLLTMYSVGIGSIAKGQYDTLLQLCQEPLSLLGIRHEEPFLTYVNPQYIFYKDNSLNMLPTSITNDGRPSVSVIRDLVRESFRNILPITREFDVLYHRMEFVLGLIAVKLGGVRFTAESVFHPRTEDIDIFLKEGQKLGDEWTLIGDLFNGDIQEFKDCLRNYEDSITQLRQYLYREGDINMGNFHLNWTSLWNE